MRPPTVYSKKCLQSIAVRAIKYEAEAAKGRARFVKWDLLVGKGTSLVAYGQRVDSGEIFAVSIAI